MVALLTKPDFKLDKPNPYSGTTTDQAWWLWLQCQKLEPKSKLGGFYADKSGFHNTGPNNKKKWPGNYSIRDKINQSGPGWTKSSAFDWTFPDAQGGNFGTIDKYTSRLWKSSHDKNDPRLDMILFEFYGNKDEDRDVDGYNEYREENVTSDSSHLWHLHFSFIRSKLGDWWGMWALYTVLAGWTVAQWRASLPATAPKPPAKPVTSTPSGLPNHKPGSRTLSYDPDEPLMKGTDVLVLQKFIGEKYCGEADGIYGRNTKSGVLWYQ